MPEDLEEQLGQVTPPAEMSSEAGWSSRNNLVPLLVYSRYANPQCPRLPFDLDILFEPARILL